MKKLSNDFYTDGKTIYYQNYGMKIPKPIPEVDFESFKIESTVFASDKNKIYAISSMREGLQIFEPADKTNVAFIDDYFADAFNLYRYNHHFIEYCNPDYDYKIKRWLQKKHKIDDAWWNLDSSFFEKNQLLAHNIYTNNNKVFFFYPENNRYDKPIHAYGLSESGNCYIELKNADINTLKVLNTFYSKDKENVYFLSRKINANPTTFKVLQHLFAKDENGIWYNGRLTAIEDIETFKIINTTLEKDEFHYAIDKSKVYTNTTTKIGTFNGYANLLSSLKNADPNTFQIINDVWAKDCNNVYWFGKIYKKGDAKTFEKISERPYTEFDFARDKNHVYIANGKTLKKGLHGGSFKILNKFWAKDDFVVYSLITDRIQKNIDVKTFKIIDENGKAEDKNYFFEITNYEVKKKKK